MKIFITGGSRGIGNAIVTKMAPRCDAVTILGRTQAHLNDVRSSLKAADLSVETLHADLGDLTALRNAVEDWMSDQSSLDALILCGGLYSEDPLASMPEGQFEYDLRVNLTSNIIITQMLIPLLRKSSAPRIVLIGSTAAYEPYPLAPSYGVAKAGLRGFAENLRSELRPTIGVSFISPGGTWTDMWEGEDLPADRLLLPSDVAALVDVSLSLSPQAVVEELVVRPIEGDIHE